MKLNVVMCEPEIPQNTGNISRTCAATGGKLHLIKPLGFEINDKQLKRAGLDYWDKLEISMYESLADFLEKYPPEENNMFFVTTKGQNCYSDIDYSKMDEVFVMFGKETKGLPEAFLEAHRDSCVRIPMREQARSLNLSNAVAITTYEALRQLSFPNLKDFGKMRDTL